MVRAGKDGTPCYEATWRDDGRQVKRRLGRAWLDPDVTVRDVLGHSDIQTTNRYLHPKIDAAAGRR